MSLLKFQFLFFNLSQQMTCHVMHFCNNEEGVGKTFQRLAVSMADNETAAAPTLSQAALVSYRVI